MVSAVRDVENKSCQNVPAQRGALSTCEGLEALLSACIAGDEKAKASLYSAHIGLVRGAVRQRLCRLGRGSLFMDEVDDIANEVFEHIFREECKELRRVRNARSILAWLVVVSHNRTVDYVRKSSRHRMIAAEDNYLAQRQVRITCSVEQHVIRNEASLYVRQLLSELTARERLVVEMFYLHGAKYVEIGRVLGMNINTVSSLVRRARGKLQENLKKARVGVECFVERPSHGKNQAEHR